MNLYKNIKEAEYPFRGKTPETEYDYLEICKHRLSEDTNKAKDLEELELVLKEQIRQVQYFRNVFKDTPENKRKRLEDERALANKCVLCGAPLEGWGNYSYPLSDRGNCCDKCNNEKVIPARLKEIAKRKGE